MGKPSKKPNRAPKSRSKKPTRDKSVKISSDAIKEYQATIKKHGLAEITALTDDDCVARVRGHISTQSLELDWLLNNLGIPLGRVTEIYGPPHIGKSTLLDHIFASVQAAGGVAALADSETSRDYRYSKNIGVDIKNLQYVKFDPEDLYIENIVDVLYQTIRYFSKNFPMVPVIFGWDALAGTSTRDEIKKGMLSGKKKSGDDDDKKSKNTQPGKAAQIMRKACRQIPALLGGTNIGIVICNHEYTSFSMGGSVGKKKETYGGEGLRHLASIRVQLWPVYQGWLKRSDGVIIGRVVGAKLIKNRLGNPWGQTQLAILSGKGVDNVYSIFERFKNAGIITTSGSWSSIVVDDQELKFQGWNGLAAKCNEDPKLFSKLVGMFKGLP